MTRIKPTITQALNWVATLPNVSPALKDEAELLLGFVLKKKRDFLIPHYGQQLKFWQWRKFRRLISKRRHGWPVAYLTNTKWFYGRPFYVDHRVLIPRPETEILVEQCIKIYDQLRNTGTFTSPNPERLRPTASLSRGSGEGGEGVGGQEHRDTGTQETFVNVIDIGTGSGCVAITLAKECPTAAIYATDISHRALRIAKRNAWRHGATNIKFYRGDLLKTVPTSLLTQPTIIVANLPYLPRFHDYQLTPREPRLALSGQNDDGLTLINKLLAQSQKYHHLTALLLEIDPRQADQVQKIINNFLPGGQVKIINDLSNQPRVAVYRGQNLET